MISILDYGVGNLASVRNALTFLDLPNTTISTASQVAGCGHLILPGVGAFSPAMQALRESGLDDALREHASVNGRPLLGICLGMQLLFETSLESGTHAGLGLMKGLVTPLAGTVGDLVVPHVGWNDVVPTRSSRLLGASAETHSFYFVHGYYCVPADPEHVIGQTSYGHAFASVVENENIFGCQFHPEKSQRHGLSVLKSFSGL